MVISRLPTPEMTIPQSMLTPDTSWFSDWPPRIRFDAKNPMYMKTTTATTSSAP